MNDTSRKLPKKDLKKVTKSGSLEAKHKNSVSAMRLLPSCNSWLDTSAPQRSVETFVLSVLLRSVTASDPFSNNNSVPSSNSSFKVPCRKARPAACECQLLFFKAAAPSALKIQREVSADLFWNVPASLFSPIAGRKVKFRRDGSLSPFSFFLQTDI